MGHLRDHSWQSYRDLDRRCDLLKAELLCREHGFMPPFAQTVDNLCGFLAKHYHDDGHIGASSGSNGGGVMGAGLYDRRDRGTIASNG